MKIDNFFELLGDKSLDSTDNKSIIGEASTIAWGKKGNKIVKKFRCPFGKRKGKLVSSLSACSKPIDIKKRMQLKKTRAKFGSRIARKAKKTKRFNPLSKRLSKLNKR